ncbi:PSD1 and planctomycete cytochrome C domain-containing protein [Prosthecobacter sp.]|uniref:PSD1 and planctomycete cytochrome C domain-containing protein n=1 Tax=Prosthecobacter sp. TaxID=1965333 RepID=UPI001DFA01BC|nr:PSD1 and planctomycete cytochrome C domain-containing protein [Prosthecobacter sp.]MCB1278231.1 PSD1 domain-containing protein [Prosthecobacter sp.]
MKTLLFFFMLSASVASQAADATESAHAGIPADQLNFFEKNIRPVLVESCYKCHSESQKVKGGLTLDTKQAMQLGGESGHPGVTPGNLAESTIYEAMTWKNDDMQMPPKQKLPDDVIANFKKWIEMGAPDPRETTVVNSNGGKRVIDMDEGRKHWAFQKPVKQTPPTVKTEGWAKTDIDKFVLAGMEAKGLHPVRDADRPTLIRRIAFDLTGLPPTPDEVRTFVADQSPDAVKRVVDMYLDSERYGERWARHWLDVARYAESSGKETNVLYPHAWRYRDYVVESFKKDKPYDQFLKEQIAGDLMKSENKRDQAEKIVATGFLAIGSKGHNQRDRRQFAMDLVDEQIDAMSQSMLGLTLACARCHDHKFDPVTQRDYYALAGIFLSSETLYGTYSQLQNANPSTLIEIDRAANQIASLAKLTPAEVAQLKSRYAEASATATKIREEVRSQSMASRDSQSAANFLRVRSSFDRADSMKADMDLFYDDGAPRTLAMGVLDRTTPVNTPILVRGDIKQPGDIVPRGLVEVLCAKGEPLNISPQSGSGRLDLAYWIASKDNPLTARVMANRVWLKLMGSGLVTTPDNFGTMGQKPSHPELLDYLAVSFMENGWSVKKLVREIMMSRAYQTGSVHDAANYAVDPDNKYHWRMSQRRLDAEEIRDAMLAVSGVINYYPVDGSPVARAGEGRTGIIEVLREVNSNPQTYRSIYLPIIRDQIPEFLSVFDFPDASLVNGDRETTNVPSQSLFLMNNGQVQGMADAFAQRIAKFEGDPQERLSYAYQLAFGREPTAGEKQAISNFWTRFPQEAAKNKSIPKDKIQGMALSAFCQGLFASAEFRYLN